MGSEFESRAAHFSLQQDPLRSESVAMRISTPMRRPLIVRFLHRESRHGGARPAVSTPVHLPSLTELGSRPSRLAGRSARATVRIGCPPRIDVVFDEEYTR